MVRAVGLWLVLFCVGMIWCIARYLCGVADIHPLLGPVVGALTVLIAGVVSTAIHQPTDVPADIQRLIIIGGIVSTSALVAVEALVLLARGSAPSDRH